MVLFRIGEFSSIFFQSLDLDGTILVLIKTESKDLVFYVYSTAKARLILFKSWKVLIWDLRGFWIIWWSRIGRGLVNIWLLNNRINYLNLEISGVKTCDRISASWDHYKTEELFAVSKHISFFFITISEVYCDFFLVLGINGSGTIY